MQSIQRTLALALTLALGPAFLPLGCGGSLGSAASGRGDADVPEGVARQIRTCAAEHSAHLHAAHSIRFDVKLANNGQVDEISLLTSTVDDEGLEACMASALRLLSEDDLVLRRAEAGPRGPVAPEARALLGQVEEALCLVSAPCVLTVAAVFGFASLTVWIYVHASPRPGIKTHAPPAVTTPPATSASPMPTTSAPPMPTTLPLPDQELWRKCQQQHDTYKQTQDEAADLAGRTAPLEDLLHNNKASAQQRVEYCHLLDKLIKVKQREHSERSKYMDLDCDKFDWFDKGTTAARRLASHQGELNNVDAALKNLYTSEKRFCP